MQLSQDEVDVLLYLAAPGDMAPDDPVRLRFERITADDHAAARAALLDQGLIAEKADAPASPAGTPHEHLVLTDAGRLLVAELLGHP